MSLTANIREKAGLIWSIADKLTGVYKPHEYGEVILPLTVIRRFDCILADTKKAVLDKNKAITSKPKEIKDIMLKQVSEHDFYNISEYDFNKLLDDPDNIEANFKSYLNGFSENVQSIIEKFKFDGHISTMANKNILFIVLKEYTTQKADMHPSKISNLEMGYIFEEIIRRFSEAHNEDAGQHYTPREVIELMVNILFNDDGDILAGNTTTKTIYDPACGTGGMLSVVEEYLKKHNKTARLLCYGQELNDQTFAICKADMLIKGNKADYIQNGNTLSDDRFSDDRFDYILSNPPFGREWKNDKTAVLKEQKLGFAGRFGAGVPAIGDGQMLFLQTAISKMKESGSRVAIIHNGSPLFTGDAGSGPSEIRKYIIENDLLEAIIALPNDLFYNTGIATYIWVLSNKKQPLRQGKVQLINANNMFEKRRKSLGNKRNDIPKHYINEITKIYGDFKESEISKIFANEDFGYSKIVVHRPLKDEDGNLILKKGKKQIDKSLKDTEKIPLTQDIEEYFQREVIPFAPDAWYDMKKTKVGYEIPFTRYFYKYTPPKPSTELMAAIMDIETELAGTLEGDIRHMREMKDSGIEWIGNVPKGWRVTTIKYLIKNIKDGTHGTFQRVDNGELLLSAKNVFDNGIVIRDNESRISKDDYISIVSNGFPHKNDILLCCVGTIGRCCIYDIDYPIAFQRSVAFLRVNNLMINKYLMYFLKSPNAITQMGQLANSSAQSGLYMGAIKQIFVSVPSTQEQYRIATYLDQKCDKIDYCIEKQKQLIKKLKKYKQSIITEAVTKGLDKNASMKDSGIEWIGDIPEGWRIYRVKNLCQLNGRIGWQGLTSKEYQDVGPYLITGVNFKDGCINWDTCVHITEERYDEAKQIQVTNGDLLITKDGTVGKVAIVDKLKEKASLNSGVLLIRPKKDNRYNIKFAYYILLSDVFGSGLK